MSTRFSMVLHAHQPPGNFDAAFQRATDECYRPFFEVLERFPGLRVSVHCSGSLLEWLEGHEPALVETMQRLTARGQVEPVSAGLYEPILALLPERDRANQVRAHRAYMRRLFGVEPIIGWLTERVWTQPLAADLAEGGIEAITLDDLHFLSAGLDAAALDRPYLTEHQGRTLTVVPAPKELRDALPWIPADRAIAAIRRHAEAGDELLVYADDMEKWGLWPGTFRTVYERGWLTRFFERLQRLHDSGVIEVAPLGEALRAVRPRERIYLPDGSYAEMMRWNLPPAAQRAEAALEARLREEGFWEQAEPFVRAGTYMEFLAKYPEVNHIHKRMLEVSARVAARHAPAAVAHDLDALPDAVRSLWRAQANCAYWHGLFGGTYLPFLRQALYHNLLSAERALESEGETRRALRVFDLDADGVEEAMVMTSALTAVVTPLDGGGIVEFSDREQGCNIADTLARREEAYHDPERPPYPYDSGRRGIFVDRFLAPGRVPARGRPVEDLGAFAGRPYAMSSRRIRRATEVALSREAEAPGGVVRVTKTFRFDDAAPRAVHAEYELTGAAGEVHARFGVEVNVAVLFGALHAGKASFDLARPLALHGVSALQFDGWQPGLRLRIASSLPADLDVRPIATVSQSEAGFEWIRQCNACLFTWPVRLAPGERFAVAVDLEVADPGERP